MKIIMVITITATFSMLLHANMYEDIVCADSYKSLLEDQKTAVNYNTLSSLSKSNLNASIRENLKNCLERCHSGMQFDYCDSVQKKIEASAELKRKQQLEKSKSWF